MHTCQPTDFCEGDMSTTGSKNPNVMYQRYIANGPRSSDITTSYYFGYCQPRLDSQLVAVPRRDIRELPYTPRALLPQSVNIENRKGVDQYYAILQGHRKLYKEKPRLGKLRYEYFKVFPPMYDVTSTMTRGENPRRNLHYKHPLVLPYWSAELADNQRHYCPRYDS